MCRGLLVLLIGHENALTPRQQTHRVIYLMVLGTVLRQDSQTFEDFFLDVEPKLGIGL